MFVIASTTNNDVRKENTNFIKELIHLLHFTIKEHTQRWNNSNRVLAMVGCMEQTQSIKECALCGAALPVKSEISLCDECIKCADCCVGLEKLKE